MTQSNTDLTPSVHEAPMQWTQQEYARFGLEPQVNQHRYHESTLFDKEQLVALLDSYPRKWLQAFTMGEDPTRADEWNCVDIPAELTGADMWQAVESGRVWLNITHIEEVDDAYRDLINGMYDHLAEHCPHLQNPRAHYSTLLISSPGAQVYYHLDAEPNMLWHLRGQKRIWVYPAMNTTFVPQEYLEDIYAGEIDENLPYQSSFDNAAVEYLLSPGDVASWPHNGPHRIVNQDLNVSLATSYYTPLIYKRQYTQLANRFLLRNLGIKNRSMQEDGLIPAAKRMTYRLVNKVRPFKRRDRSASYITDLQLDPNGELGLRKLSAAQPASFSRLAQAKKTKQRAEEASTAA